MRAIWPPRALSSWATTTSATARACSARTGSASSPSRTAGSTSSTTWRSCAAARTRSIRTSPTSCSATPWAALWCAPGSPAARRARSLALSSPAPASRPPPSWLPAAWPATRTCSRTGRCTAARRSTTWPSAPTTRASSRCARPTTGSPATRPSWTSTPPTRCARSYPPAAFSAT